MPSHLAYLTSSDPFDKRSWSGTHHSVYSALQREFNTVTSLGPWQPEALLRRDRYWSYFGKILTGKRFDYQHSLRLAKAYSAYFTPKLGTTEADAVFAVSASTELAFLETKLPVYYVADATFANMVNYYPYYSSLSRESIRQGNEVQQRALSKCTALFFPSEWAANSAMKDYGIESSRIHVLSFGANLAESPEPDFHSTHGIIHLLFVGVEWERKGGPKVVEAVNTLRKSGKKVHLTIIGCTPGVRDEDVTIIPFLNKNIPADREQLNKAFSDADFFILPTTAECFGAVFCEASAFGVPSLAANTGGVSGAVQQGVNGFLLSPAANGSDYAKLILELTADSGKLLALRKSTRKLYEECLNWKSWGEKVKRVLSSSQLQQRK